METPSTYTRDLALRLLSLEAENRVASDPHEAELVYETLRVSLTRFAGADGFLALARRSLALARVEVPSLNAVQVRTDGWVEGLDGLVTVDDVGREAGAALTTYLLWLLETFVGATLATRLVREAWPDVEVGH